MRNATSAMLTSWMLWLLVVMMTSQGQSQEVTITVNQDKLMPGEKMVFTCNTTSDTAQAHDVQIVKTKISTIIQGQTYEPSQPPPPYAITTNSAISSALTDRTDRYQLIVTDGSGRSTNVADSDGGDAGTDAQESVDGDAQGDTGYTLYTLTINDSQPEDTGYWGCRTVSRGTTNEVQRAVPRSIIVYGEVRRLELRRRVAQGRSPSTLLARKVNVYDPQVDYTEETDYDFYLQRTGKLDVMCIVDVTNTNPALLDIKVTNVAGITTDVTDRFSPSVQYSSAVYGGGLVDQHAEITSRLKPGSSLSFHQHDTLLTCSAVVPGYRKQTVAYRVKVKTPLGDASCEVYSIPFDDPSIPIKVQVEQYFMRVEQREEWEQRQDELEKERGSDYTRQNWHPDDNIKIVCSLYAYPPPFIKWYKGTGGNRKQELDLSRNRNNTDKYRCHQKEGRGGLLTATLYINKLDPDTEQFYYFEMTYVDSDPLLITVDTTDRVNGTKAPAVHTVMCACVTLVLVLIQTAM